MFDLLAAVVVVVVSVLLIETKEAFAVWQTI
jgi:hypothetical protein